MEIYNLVIKELHCALFNSCGVNTNRLRLMGAVCKCLADLLEGDTEALQLVIKHTNSFCELIANGERYNRIQDALNKVDLVFHR